MCVCVFVHVHRCSCRLVEMLDPWSYRRLWPAQHGCHLPVYFTAPAILHCHQSPKLPFLNPPGHQHQLGTTEASRLLNGAAHGFGFSGSPLCRQSAVRPPSPCVRQPNKFSFSTYICQFCCSKTLPKIATNFCENIPKPYFLSSSNWKLSRKE